MNYHRYQFKNSFICHPSPWEEKVWSLPLSQIYRKFTKVFKMSIRSSRTLAQMRTKIKCQRSLINYFAG